MKIFSAILIILSLGVSFFYTYDRLYVDQITDLQADVREFESKIEESEAARAKLASLTAEYERLSSSDRERLERMAPEKVGDIRLAMDVTNLLSSNNVQIQGISLPSMSSSGSGGSGSESGVPERQGALPKQISFNITAGYRSFTSLLEEVERSLRIIDVTGIEFGVGGEGEGAPSSSSSDIYTYNVTGYIYELDTN